MGDEASFSVPTVLTPSQALGPSSKQSTSKQSTSTANTTNNEAGGPSKRRRNRPRQKPKSTTETNQDANVEDDKKDATQTKKNKNRSRRRKGRQQKVNQDNEPLANINNDNYSEEVKQEALQPTKKATKSKSNNKRNRKNRKRYPWRRFVPPGEQDPITLEDIVSLEYPPFALVATEPFVPVPVWPIPEISSTSNQVKQETVEEINRKRLKEQWGPSLIASDESKHEVEPDKIENPSKRHYHLYDGRALAYYLVSQLQFIDPLNRRDLTRPELLNLDEYLKRHGFKDINVTEAYDAKGITLSSAGAAANTAQGRAEIMQQIASNLLNSLFGNLSVAATPRTDPVPSQEQNQTFNTSGYRQGAAVAHDFGNHGFYASEDGGLMIIDDDENPGMRDANYEAAAAAAGAAGNLHIDSRSQTFAPNPFYTSGHIADLHGGSRGSLASPNAFPALPKANNSGDSATTVPQPTKAARKSKTLARIAGAVKKTDPEEVQRQWEAREEARRRALLSNLSFGVDASMMNDTKDLLKPPPGGLESNVVTASEGQLLRNRAFADALGVKPATVRKQFNSGWARPADAMISTDEFGNELNAAIYPDGLILEAKEMMQLLLKVEKKWKAFLTDDSAASLPLNAMDRPSRKFVHEYSDFWNLKTESFDPEPKRYIHCVKMTNTMMPHPLLSDVARKWRGPTPQPLKSVESDHPFQQTAGQSTRSIPPNLEHRVPLPLKPLSIPEGEQRDFLPVKTEKGVPGEGEQQNSRFDSLATSRERPKIALAKRTVPLELPPFEPQKAFDLAEDMKRTQERLEEKRRKEREMANRKKKALENAFASDDEEAGQSSDSEWGEEEPLYNGDSDEE